MDELDDKAGKEFLAVVRSLFDIYTGNFVNEPVPRGKTDTPEHLHLVAGVFVKDEYAPRYLVQRRATTKDSYPNHFTDSASGHVQANSRLDLHAIKAEIARELDEEMGITLDPDTFLLWTVLHDPTFNEIKFVFVTQAPSAGLTPDTREVNPDGTGWYHEDQLKAMLKTEAFVETVKDLWNTFIDISRDFGTLANALEPWQAYWAFFGDLVAWKRWMTGQSADQKTPIFIGRFQPFHNGHFECLRAIRESYDDVIIGIGSPQYARMERNPLKYEERKHIIQESIKVLGFSRSFIIPIPDVHCEHLWMENVCELFENRIVLFSNNDWVRGLAADAGVQVGKKLAFDVDTYNGTRVRQLIKDGKPWESLVPGACAKYVKDHQLERFI